MIILSTDSEQKSSLFQGHDTILERTYFVLKLKLFPKELKHNIDFTSLFGSCVVFQDRCLKPLGHPSGARIL